jgi:GDP-D-mannose 3',5'-epimerase
VCTTIREVAELVVTISGKDIPIEYDVSAPEGDRGRCADYTKARELLGWSPEVTMADGLARLYAWMEHQLQAAAHEPVAGLH